MKNETIHIAIVEDDNEIRQTLTLIIDGSKGFSCKYAFPDGEYSIEVTATNSGIDVPINVLETGSVDGLRYENNVAVVQVNGHEFYVSEIYKVS